MTLKDRLVRLPLVVSLAAILPFAGFAGCKGFPLVSDGKAVPIVIPAEAEASTELAAKGAGGLRREGLGGEARGQVEV